MARVCSTRACPACSVRDAIVPLPEAGRSSGHQVASLFRSCACLVVGGWVKSVGKSGSFGGPRKNSKSRRSSALSAAERRLSVRVAHLSVVLVGCAVSGDERRWGGRERKVSSVLNSSSVLDFVTQSPCPRSNPLAFSANQACPLCWTVLKRHERKGAADPKKQIR